MTASILSIGTELTRGEVVNTNAAWLADQLSTVGLETTHIEVVPDDPALVREALIRATDRCSVCICTGGLGPTTDDLTTQCAASVLGVPLERDDVSLERIRQRILRQGRPMAPCNQKQADFPRGARILANDWGTAPGFEIRRGACRAYFLPGVPAEMKSMYEHWIAPEIQKLVSEHHYQIRIRTFGQSESAINEALTGVEELHHITLGYRVHFPEIEVKVLVRSEDLGEARIRALSAAEEIRQRLGEEVVYGEGETSLSEVVGDLLTQRELSVAVAESCTAGLLAAQITDAPGASRYFRGGVVAYANDVKSDILGVSDALLLAHGAVSPEVALALARGAARLFRASIGVGITGIAGPGGGSQQKPVGLVHLAAVRDTQVETLELRFPSTRDRIRRLASFSGLALIRRLLEIDKPIA